ncbi:probable serine/threonine-protein kinase kinX [Halichondria panicea]|uniref:probable serine/threonine-protein kinase kinX n=1 Tax=Halichondria panicea TaxID=6063 RepID=UPI00312BB7B2
MAHNPPRIEIYKSPEGKLGIGAYGAVYRAKLNELPCAAKILHPILLETNDPSGQKIVERFYQECELMRNITHPNIVQYLDVTMDPDSGLPVLLMELLDESLTNYFDRVQRPPPYHTQVNLSHDIALAIAHLHSKGIVHRDLSSNNVLLIAGSKAKVSDFGMSKLLNVSGNFSRHSLTQLPGTQAFMPPEAFFEPPNYSSMIDCFSVGPLIIQLITAKFPDPGPRFTMVPDERSPVGTTQMPVLEENRRMNHIALINPSHSLLPIARQCLEYQPDVRITAQQLCRQVAQLKEQQVYIESKELPVHGDIENEFQSALAAKQNQIERLQQHLHDETQHKEEIIEQLKRKQSELSEKETQVETLALAISNKTSELSKKEAELLEKENISQQFQERLAKATETIKEREKNIDNLTEELRETEPKKQSLETPEICPESDQVPLESIVPLKWRRGANAICKMYHGSTAVDGSLVYFKNGQNKYIYQYNIDLETWQKIQNCPRYGFSLALIGGVLTAVGGTDAYAKETNTLLSFVYENGSTKWTEKYPAMPTKRTNTTAVANGHLLIVIGGVVDGKHQISTVELLDLPKGQWYKACDLPHIVYQPSATICGDSIYLTGWKDPENHPSTGVLTASLTMLREHATLHSFGGWLSSLTGPRQPPFELIWGKLAELPVIDSTCATINGDQLLAIGGETTDTKQYTSAVYHYDVMNNMWVKISDMIRGRSSCLVAVVSTNKVIVVGGFTGPGIFTDAVDIGCFN